jgi:predicted house-cleaning NTP pyrophosphatase (Maf/HAM1 superfamily)
VVEIADYSDDVLVELIESKSWQGKAGAYDLAGAMGDFAQLVDGAEICVLGFASLAIDELLRKI